MLIGKSRQEIIEKNIFLWQHRISSSCSPSQAPAPGAQLNNWLLALCSGCMQSSNCPSSSLLTCQSSVITDPDTTHPDHHVKTFLIKTPSSSLFLSTSAAGVNIVRLLLSKCLLIGSWSSPDLDLDLSLTTATEFSSLNQQNLDIVIVQVKYNDNVN